MKKKNYSFEEKYVSVVLNWRRSGDERGLSELKRSQYNYDMLNFLLDELITQCYDLSTLDVNR